MASVDINVPNYSVFNRDNIDILRGINSNSVDLIYLDPPFNTKKSFTAPIGSSAEGASFKDIFYAEDIKDEWLETIRFENTSLHSFLLHTKTDGIAHNFAYLAYMAIRLIECHRILKDTGSIYLHVDPTMSHYLKVVLDNIFGDDNFRNEIIWHYYNGSNRSHKNFGRKHDIILFYSKSENGVYNYDEMREPYSEDSSYAKGTKYGDKGFIQGNQMGKLMHDVWRIPSINNMAKERTGYPTQKPIVLLERIITASSNEGDVVLDPFCGCATACVAAERLNRRWIGVDISIEAYNLIQQRLDNELPGLEKVLWRKKINFSTTPPKRTDQGLPENVEQGYIYVISHPILTPHYAEGKMTYKVGIAKNFERRLASYQTGSPGRAYVEEYKTLTPKYKEIERAIFERFDGDRENEWITANKLDIIAAIEQML